MPVDTAAVAVFVSAALAAARPGSPPSTSPPPRRPANQSPAGPPVDRPATRHEQIARACSARWYADLVNHRDVDADGNLTGSGSRKVRCRGACGLLVPPQDVAACVIADRPLSPRDARRRGIDGPLLPVCDDCRMRSPPPRDGGMVDVVGHPGVRRFPLERLGGFVPYGPAVLLMKVSPAYAGNVHEAVVEDPASGEDGYDGSVIGDALTAIMLGRLKLTEGALPTGGTARPVLELAEGMTPEERAVAAADHDDAVRAYEEEERTLADAVEVVRQVSPDGRPPAMPATAGMTDAEVAEAGRAHDLATAEYKAAMQNFYEATRVNRSEGEQAWRRSRGRRRPGPNTSAGQGTLAEPS